MMGEGFVVMQSSDIKLHFYMDQPGKQTASLHFDTLIYFLF